MLSILNQVINSILRCFNFQINKSVEIFFSIAKLIKKIIGTLLKNSGESSKNSHENSPENSSKNFQNFPENDPKKENKDDSSNSEPKIDFEDEKNVMLVSEIKNKKASERTKQEILFVIEYHKWLGKDV